MILLTQLIKLPAQLIQGTAEIIHELAGFFALPLAFVITLRIATWIVKRMPLPRLVCYCPKCDEWHPIIYATDPKTGKETDMIMGIKCKGSDYLVGVAGQAIDGHIFRPAPLPKQ